MGIVRAGEVLADKYRIERELGAGGMGFVLAATHLDLDQLVAIKLLRPELATNEEVVARFLREAKAAVRLRSEHVARVFDVGRLASGEPYLVMEYLHGANLAQAIETDGALPIELAVDYLLQACEAIAEAHACGIIHRDLKPENLFLAWGPEALACVKVFDFGISKIQPGGVLTGETSQTRTAAVLGSPRYMSPEQMRASRAVDERTDIWALGTILFEMLTARPVWSGETLYEVSAQVLHSDPPRVRALRAEVPEELDAIVHRCLAKDRDQRVRSIKELAEELLPFGSNQSAGVLDRIQRLVLTASQPPKAKYSSWKPSTTSNQGPLTETAPDPDGARTLIKDSGAQGAVPSTTPPEATLHTLTTSASHESGLATHRTRRLSRPLVAAGLGVFFLTGIGLYAAKNFRSGEQPAPAVIVSSSLQAEPLMSQEPSVRSSYEGSATQFVSSTTDSAASIESPTEAEPMPSHGSPNGSRKTGTNAVQSTSKSDGRGSKSSEFGDNRK